MNQQSELTTKVLNSHIGTNNIIETKDLHETMMVTFENLGTILKEHCGPYGRYAIINNLLHPTAEPVFTKDGINIIRNIEYVSAMEEFCRRMVAYVGSRIESEAGDGTTSAMLLTVEAMGYLCDKLFNRKKEDTKGLNFSYKGFKQEFEEFLDSYEKAQAAYLLDVDKIHELAIDEDDNLIDGHTYHDTISIIAYHQAYTSSHGDIELAEAVGKVFLYTPEEAWDHICFDREGFETENRITYDVDVNQFTIDTRVFDRAMLNKDLGTTYESIGELLTLGDDLILGSLNYMMLLKKIEQCINLNETLVIVCSSNMCQQTRDGLKKALNSEQPHQVAIFEHRPEDPNINDLMALNLICGIPMASPVSNKEFLTTSDVEVLYEGGKLKLNNLYENPDESFIHPLRYAEGEAGDSIRYILNHIEGYFDKIKTGNTYKGMQSDIMRFRKLYNKILLTRRGVVRIGGSAHDNTATIDVVADVVSAVRNSLKHGFVLANGNCMRHVLRDLPETTFKQAFLYAVDQVEQAVYKYSPYECNGGSGYLFSIDLISNTKKNVNLLEDWYDRDSGFVIQPANIDVQVLKRFGELALKFLCSNRVVSPGGVYINEE